MVLLQLCRHIQNCLNRLFCNCCSTDVENWVVHFDLFTILLERESEGGCPALPVCSEKIPPRRVWRRPENLPGTESVASSQPFPMSEENERKWLSFSKPLPRPDPFPAALPLPNHSLTRIFPKSFEWPWTPPPLCNLVVLHRALAFYSSETAKQCLRLISSN